MSLDLRARLTLVFHLVVSVLALSCVVARARAEPPQPPSGYAELIDEALGELRAGHFTEARALFERAHVLYPNARTLRGLGFVTYELRSYAESVSFLRQALQASERPLDPALRTDTQEQLRKARRFVADLRLRLSPAETRVLLDGREPVQAQPGGLLVDLGTHTLTLEAAGYRAETRSFDVRGGEAWTWNVALEAMDGEASASGAPPLPATPPPASGQPREPSREGRKWARSPWFWIGSTLVVGAVAAGVAVALTRAGETQEGEPMQTAQTPANGVLQTLLGAR